VHTVWIVLPAGETEVLAEFRFHAVAVFIRFLDHNLPLIQSIVREGGIPKVSFIIEGSCRAAKWARTSNRIYLGGLVNVKPSRSISWLLLLVFVVTSALIAQQGAKSSSPGASTFKNKCVLCHGIDGAGKTALGKQLQAANLGSKDVQKLGDAELHKIVHDGQANMPAFADQLSDSEIAQVIKYVRHFGNTATK